MKTDVNLCRAFLQVPPSVGVDLLDMCVDCAYMCDDCFYSGEFGEYEEGIFNHCLFLGRGFTFLAFYLDQWESFSCMLFLVTHFFMDFSSCSNSLNIINISVKFSSLNNEHLFICAKSVLFVGISL